MFHRQDLYGTLEVLGGHVGEAIGQPRKVMIYGGLMGFHGDSMEFNGDLW